jgi:quinol monooxygenase YgiN
MFTVDARITVRPDQSSAFVAMMEQVVAATRLETGNHAFRLTADLHDPGVFSLFEHWESEVALCDHFRQPYLVELGAAVSDFGFEITGTRYDITGSEPVAEVFKRLFSETVAEGFQTG